MDIRNPIITGFHPDPSVVQVGEDYYLANSTFEYYPGIPIFHSTDLTQWELIGHVAVREGQLGSHEARTGGGAWAPTIRHHDGRFWLVIPDMMGGRGNVLFTAERPEGPWSDGVVMDVLGIDPDIAWDEDGVCHVTMSGFILEEDGTLTHQGITQVQLDTETGAALTEPKHLWSGSGGMFPEAPHVYRIGDWWYLMIAEGGTERGHSVTIARGPAIDGPFEPCPHNPIVTARGSDRPAQNTGHGDLVRTPDGGWAMVLLGTRPRSMTRAFAPMGRETFLTPVTWQDGWPHAEPVHLGERHDAVERSFTFPSDAPAALDGFDPEIIAVRQFPREVADLATRPGWARLLGAGEGMEAFRPVFLGVRQCTEGMTVEVTLDVSDGVGGLSMRFDENFHLDMEVDGSEVTATMAANLLQQSWTHTRADADPVVRLRIVAKPAASGQLGVTVGCDLLRAEVFDGGEWVGVGRTDGRYLSSDVAESFTGRVVGPYARSGTVYVERIDYAGRDIERGALQEH